jgi:hypothetical protein
MKNVQAKKDTSANSEYVLPDGRETDRFGKKDSKMLIDESAKANSAKNMHFHATHRYVCECLPMYTSRFCETYWQIAASTRQIAVRFTSGVF